MASTSDVLKRFIVELDVGGMSQRDTEYRLESALGHFVLGKRTVRELSATLSDEDDAWRTRDLSKETVTYLFSDGEFEQQLRSLREQLQLDEQEVSTGELSLPVHTRRNAASAA